jgi:penicillin-insensitive murein endopeptidase
MHVRLACPPGESMCQNQEPPPEGDGCGAELTAWLKSKDWLPGNAPETLPAPIPLNALPDACLEVLHAPDMQRTAVNR